MSRVLVIPVEGQARIHDGGVELEDVQALVGGDVQLVVAGTDWHLLVDEEGRLKGLPVNAAGTMMARALGWRSGEILVGTVVVVGLSGEDWGGAPAHVFELAASLDLVDDL